MGLHAPGLTSLELSNSILVLPNLEVEWSLCLPSLTHLTLSNMTCESADPNSPVGDFAQLLAPTVLPNLTHLSAIRTGPADNDSLISPGTAYQALLGQLTSLYIHGYMAWLWHEAMPFWQSLTKLEHLSTSDPDEIVQFALEHIPSPLATLDLSRYEDEPEESAAGNGPEFEWDKEWMSVKKLGKVVLPARETWSDEAGARKPAVWLEQVAAAARAQGARVEYK
jgi:hypothetical protein